MEIDLKSFVIGFISGHGPIHTSLLFRELDSKGFNEHVYKTTVLEMIDEKLINRKGTHIELY